MTDIVLRWAGDSTADVNTDYKIYSDKAASGTFVLATTANSSSPYVSVSTTLTTAVVTSTPGSTISLEFGSGTSFSNGDYVVIDKEIFLLGGKSTNTFATCTGGQLGTIRQDHAAAVAIYKLHETYTDTGVNLGTPPNSRHVIRYHIAKLQGTTEYVPAEAVFIFPTNPPTNGLTTVWGILSDIQGTPEASVIVSLVINQSDNYQPGTAESLFQETETYTTDADGYFEFFVPRDVDHAGGDMFTITIPAGTGGTVREHAIATVPDVDWVNFEETA